MAQLTTNPRNYTNIYTFTNGADGSGSYGGLIFSGDTFYGASPYGGTNGVGTIFSVKTNGTDFTVLYTFVGGNPTGAPGVPYCRLLLCSNVLYGTTLFGGTNGQGVIFKVNIDGTGFTILHNCSEATNDDNTPAGALVLSGNTLYGLAGNGGSDFYAYNKAVIFAVNTDGSGYTNLYNFTTFNYSFAPGTLTLLGNVLYGSTADNIFAANIDGTGLTNLTTNTAYCSELTVFSNKLYGMSLTGQGTIFSMNLDGTGLTNLCTLNPNLNGNMFWAPALKLFARSNMLFGMQSCYSYSTASPPNNGNVTSVFSVNTDGSNFRTLYSVYGSRPDGPCVVGDTLYGVFNSSIFSISVTDPVIIPPAFNPDTRFYRITGPSAAVINQLRSDGNLIWSNAIPGQTYTIQASSAVKSNWVDYTEIVATNGVNTNLIVSFNPPTNMTLIPAGWFIMGDTLDGETDAAPVLTYVSSFYMDTNLVSDSQWQSVLNWASSNGYVFSPYNVGGNYPFDGGNWFNKVQWCNARSQMAGLTPVYYLNGNVFNNGDCDQTITADWSANGYRLPTEAEWERAARGGLKQQRFPWGYFSDKSLANYYSITAEDYLFDLGPDNGFNSYGSSPVGKYPPNNYGLYDMAGNVAEYVWDAYGTPYTGGVNPHGPVQGSGNPVYRGGGNGQPANAMCCARRNFFLGCDSPGFIGFRCVRNAGP